MKGLGGTAAEYLPKVPLTSSLRSQKYALPTENRGGMYNAVAREPRRLSTQKGALGTPERVYFLCPSFVYSLLITPIHEILNSSP